MTPDLLYKAILLGLVNAAPIGPVGLLCLKKNVEPDRWSGLSAALGMAVAYAIISFCVLFGLKWVAQTMEEYRVALQVGGGILLIAMGARSLFSTARRSRPQQGSRSGYVGDFASSFAMTLFNPVPFATFTVILTALRTVNRKLDLREDFLFAGCVMFGTLVFWGAVNQLLHVIRSRSATEWTKWIHHGAAIALVVFGVVILVAGFAGFAGIA